MKNLTRKQRKMLYRILLAAALLIAIKLLPAIYLPVHVPLVTTADLRMNSGPAYFLSPWLFYLVPYAIIGWDVLWKAVRNILNGQVFDENFLMALATVEPLPPESTPRRFLSCFSTKPVSFFRTTPWASPASPSPP